MLATGPDNDNFCVSTYFDQDADSQRYSVDLLHCSFSEDEVEVFYLANGSPELAAAARALDERLDGCLEDPAFLPMVKWPPGAHALVVEAWDLRASRDGQSLSLMIRGNETGADPMWELKIPADHEIESVHLAPSFAVVRTVGEVDGAPVSECHTTPPW
ncbi:MAG: hypothetical protein Tsb0020_36470 [Haliangiales bacterium]